jgi:hypothetical protein
MANEQKEVKAPEKHHDRSANIAINIAAAVVIIAVSFAAGFGLCKVLDNAKHDKDGRPDLEEMRQRGNQNQDQRQFRNNNRKAPQNNNKNESKNESSDSQSQS